MKILGHAVPRPPVARILRSGELAHWFYRGGRPNHLARWLNAAQAAASSRGIGLRRSVTVEVRGRRTGRIITFPMVVADYQGQRYLVSMLGEQANWVANVRADGGRAVIRQGSAEAVRLEEVPVRQRAPILRRYLDLAPGARAHIPVDRHAPLEAFEQIAAQIPVFAITPRTAG